jgi:predicted transcriptional regulator
VNAKRTETALSKPLTSVELEMMNVIWRIGPCPVAQVREQLLPERDLAYTSVSTIIRILEQKGYVKSTKVGKAHLYEARVSKESYQATILALLVEKVFDGAPSLLVRHLLHSDALSPTDIAEIEALLQKESRSS